MLHVYIFTTTGLDIFMGHITELELDDWLKVSLKPFHIAGIYLREEP